MKFLYSYTKGGIFNYQYPIRELQLESTGTRSRDIPLLHGTSDTVPIKRERTVFFRLNTPH
jgi:hypothetical protein